MNNACSRIADSRRRPTQRERGQLSAKRHGHLTGSENENVLGFRSSIWHIPRTSPSPPATRTRSCAALTRAWILFAAAAVDEEGEAKDVIPRYWTEVRWSCAMAAVPSGAVGGRELSAAAAGGGCTEAASFAGCGGESSALGGAGRAVGGGIKVCAKPRRPACERPDVIHSATVRAFLPSARFVASHSMWVGAKTKAQREQLTNDRLDPLDHLITRFDLIRRDFRRDLFLLFKSKPNRAQAMQNEDHALERSRIGGVTPARLSRVVVDQAVGEVIELADEERDERKGRGRGRVSREGQVPVEELEEGDEGRRDGVARHAASREEKVRVLMRQKLPSSLSSREPDSPARGKKNRNESSQRVCLVSCLESTLSYQLLHNEDAVYQKTVSVSPLQEKGASTTRLTKAQTGPR